MKKLLIASVALFAMTGSAWACGELPAVKASSKPDVKASNKPDVEVVIKTEAKEEITLDDKTSSSPEVQAD